MKHFYHYCDCFTVYTQLRRISRARIFFLIFFSFVFINRRICLLFAWAEGWWLFFAQMFYVFYFFLILCFVCCCDGSAMFVAVGFLLECVCARERWYAVESFVWRVGKGLIFSLYEMWLFIFFERSTKHLLVFMTSWYVSYECRIQPYTQTHVCKMNAFAFSGIFARCSVVGRILVFNHGPC